MNPLFLIQSVHNGIPEPAQAKFLLISITLHCIVLVVIPLLTALTYRPQRFARPPTFQLVTMNIPAPPARSAAEIAAVQPPTEKGASPTAARLVPRKSAKKAAREENIRKKENLSGLSELLSSIPATTVSEITPAQNFRYNWYIQNIVSRVEDQWKPPPGLSNRQDVDVVVSFSILQDGSITTVTISKSSGIAGLDQLAVQAINLAAPFGQLPLGFSGSKLDIAYTLHYVK